MPKGIEKLARNKYVLLSGVILLAVLVAGEFFYIQRYRAKNTVLQEKIDSLSAKASILKRRAREAENKIESLKAELEKEKMQAESLASRLEEEEKARRDAAQQLAGLETRLKEEQNRAQKTQQRLQEALAELEGLRQKMQALALEKQRLSAQLQKLNAKKVSLGAVVVNSSSEAASSPAVEGKVIAVVKEYNFCVINVGSINGVQEGDIFSLYHKGHYLGDIKIDKVKETLAAGEFLSPSLFHALRKGDRALYKGSAE